MCSVTTALDLKSLVKKGEIVVSTDLINRCLNNGLGRVNARQIVRRNSAAQGLWRSEKLCLEANGRLFCHADLKNSPGFRDALLPVQGGFSRSKPHLVRPPEKLSRRASREVISTGVLAAWKMEGQKQRSFRQDKRPDFVGILCPPDKPHKSPSDEGLSGGQFRGYLEPEKGRWSKSNSRQCVSVPKKP